MRSVEVMAHGQQATTRMPLQLESMEQLVTTRALARRSRTPCCTGETCFITCAVPQNANAESLSILVCHPYNRGNTMFLLIAGLLATWHCNSSKSKLCHITSGSSMFPPCCFVPCDVFLLYARIPNFVFSLQPLPRLQLVHLQATQTTSATALCQIAHCIAITV